MRIDCPHCFQKAVITSRNTLSPTVSDLYCQCQNLPECGASFVFTLAYKHQLNPPINNTRQLAAHLLRNLTPGDLAALLQGELFN